MDCPGFMVGSAVEKQGIIGHGAKMLARGLEIGETKHVDRPWRKHGVLPV
jgi:hypothetical protein